MSASVRRLTVAVLALSSFAAIVSADDPPSEPAQRQSAFLAKVVSGELDAGFKELLAGSSIASDVKAIANLVAQTQNGVRVYGAISEARSLGTVALDANLVVGHGLACCEKQPLYYYFVWYRPTATAPWRILTTWFNDNTKEFIDARRGLPPSK